ncbi:MAG TPA: hypothetical protein VG429_12690 [Casimicrobiaceae bacterium]|jgi:hypothetical protein|nr:hypothetical protein [Casimicrobiaceae bacterium]
MSRRLRSATERLQRARNFAAGLLIGSAGVTPVFAATDIAIDDLSRPLLVGSLILLAIGLGLKAKRRKAAPIIAPPAPPPAFSEGIGRYRLQLGRGDAD